MRILTTLWLFLFAICLILYFQWNGPLRAVALNLIPLIFALTFVFSWTGIGWLLARYFIRDQGKWICFAGSLAFGLGMTGVLTFTLGMSGSFRSGIYGIWYLIGLFSFVHLMFRLRPYAIGPVRWNVWNTCGAAILTLFLLAGIPFVVAPEISTDALSYHLLIPKIYLQRGEISHIPLHVQSNYPGLASYNYLPILMLTNEIVCKCFHFWIGAVLLITIGRIVKKAAPEFSLLLAPAFFLSMPVTAIHMGWAWNDFMYNLFAILAVYFLLHYHLAAVPFRKGMDLFLAGLMTGLASWTKYTFVLFSLSLLVVLWIGVRKWKWDQKHYFGFFAGIGLFAVFWMLPNWMFTGNPFYPFLNPIFQSPYWSDATNSHFMEAVRRYEISDWSWTTFFTLPIHMIVRPRLADIHTGVLPLVLVPLLLIKSPTRGVSFLKSVLGSYILIWLFIQTENRSLFLAFALLFCGGSIALQQIDWSRKSGKTATIAFLAVATAASFFITLVTTYFLADPVQYFIGKETKSQYLSRLLESHEAYEFLNGKPEVNNVLLVSSHAPYYLNRPFYFSSWIDPPVAQVLLQNARNPKEMAEELRKRGITHLMINIPDYEDQNRKGLYTWNAGQRRNFEQFVVHHCKQLIRFGEHRIFEITG